jgi:bifunctional NMN adenylyltransferase/nudix hydrolase
MANVINQYTRFGTTVIIGRFSPLHLGHCEMLLKALNKSEIVIILIGSSNQARSLKNPFTFEERSCMINSWIKSEYENFAPYVCIRALVDHPYNDALWIKSVQDVVHEVHNNIGSVVQLKDKSISISGSDRDESTWYLSAFPQWKSDLVPEHCIPAKKQGLSATSVRNVLFKDFENSESKASQKEQHNQKVSELQSVLPRSTAEFLSKFMKTKECSDLRAERAFIDSYKAAWSAAPYAPTFLTVDAVVIQSGHVLVVQRAAFPGKGLWALPGGFLDQNERLVDGCVRELIEETGIKIPEAMLRGIARNAPKEIFDKPDRSLRGRTVTTAFLIKLDDTKPLPKVKGQNAPLRETGGKEVQETSKAFWLPIGEALANSDKFFEDHLPIISWGISQSTSR